MTVANGRYSRQVMLPEIGEEGQRKIASSSVLIVGLGGLGSPVSMYLAGAGVGRIPALFLRYVRGYSCVISYFSS